MIERKDFWTLKPHELGNPRKRQVIIIDGKPTFYCDYCNDKVSRYPSPVEETDATFYESEEEARKVSEERGKKVMEALKVVYDHYDEIEYLTQTVSLDTDSQYAYDWYNELDENDYSGYINKDYHRSRMKKLAQFLTGTPMTADARAFTYANIAHVDKCKDGDKYFYKVMLNNGTKITVRKEYDMDILDAAFNLRDEVRVFICDGELKDKD